MHPTLVVAADAGRARIFRLEDESPLPQTTRPTLREVEAHKNRTQLRETHENFTNTRTGRREQHTGPAHRHDDHREAHMEEFQRHFAEVLADAVERLASPEGQDLILCVAPGFRGTLVEQVERQLGHAPREVLTKDLTKLPTRELQQYLAGRGLLPSRSER